MKQIRMKGNPVGISFIDCQEIDSPSAVDHVMARRSNNDEYILFSSSDDQIDGYGVVDLIDRSTSTYYITSNDFVFAGLPEYKRFPNEYERIQPTSGEYYMLPNPVNVKFRTKDTGFSLEYSQVRCSVNDKIIPFDMTIIEIDKSVPVKLCQQDSGNYYVKGAIKIKGNPTAERDKMAAQVLFGTTNQLAINAAHVIADEVMPRQMELTKESLLETISSWFKKATLFRYEGSIQGSAVLHEMKKIITTLMFGPEMAAFLSDKYIDKVSWEDGVLVPWYENKNLYNVWKDMTSISAAPKEENAALTKLSFF